MRWIARMNRLIGIAFVVVLLPSAADAGAPVTPRETEPAAVTPDEAPGAAVPASLPSGDGKTGFGRIALRGEWFYVDGEPFLVKGIGYSPLRPGQMPWKPEPPDLAVIERDFQRIAAAGFNTIRTWSTVSPEVLQLANRHGLSVLVGVWLDRTGNYSAPSYQESVLHKVANEVALLKGQPNVLGVLIGNELIPEQVYESGIGEVQALLRRAVARAHEIDAGRVASYANWPSLAFFDASGFDAAAFNVYPYEPSSVSHVFGFRSYVEHLKRTVAKRMPLLISEVGLSVSPTGSPKPGYGGLTPAAQAAGLVKLWDELFQAGAQGGVLFEWNDEWWKHSEHSSEDPAVHDPADPEEWFGLIEFSGAGDREGRPRPAYEALKNYNQAILLSPVSGDAYVGRVPVTIYATPTVQQIRVRLDKHRWQEATRLNAHWWKVVLPIGGGHGAAHTFVMEAYDASRRLLLTRQRTIYSGAQPGPMSVTISTDRSSYDVHTALEPIRYTFTVRDSAGRPVPKYPVSWSVAEPIAKIDLTQTKPTDAAGQVQGTYLVREPGMVIISAAVPRTPNDRERRSGEETFIVVRRLANAIHQPSPWEAGAPDDVRRALRHDKPVFHLSDPGKEQIIDYARYGTFSGVGTPAYTYTITDWEGLSAAAGEGIYPNDAGLLRDPAYQAAKKAGKLEGAHWDFVFIDDPQLVFYRWAEAEEEPGVRQFYVGLALERAGLWLHAVKAYHAVLVHFPMSIGWTAFDPPTPWFVGKVARDKIEAILRLHPELGMRLDGSSFVVQGGFDNSVDNDVIAVSPGALVAVPAAEAALAPDRFVPPPVAKTIGRGRIKAVQYRNSHWQLLVDGKPWVIHGMSYQPSAVGESPDEGTLKDWMQADRDGNGTLDVFETFLDANRNNARDPDEPVAGDFALLKELGVNTIRLYHHASNKELLRQLHRDYGLMFLIGDFVGMYTVGSGAKWEDGTDYLDPVQRKRMFESVKQMVREHKDEPYLLMWVLGNENNYGGVHGIVGGKGNAAQHPIEYYAFINELATWIHQEDPQHLVSIANGDLGFLDVLAAHAPAVDVLGANVYRGWHGFGRSFFEEVKRHLDKPVYISEYGCPSYQTDKSREVAERDQAVYHLGNWVDLADNMAGRGLGNAVGGVVFEFNDEWWKGGQPPRFSPHVQETQPNWAGPYPGGWNFEEWYGLVSQGNGSMSPRLRQARSSYLLYKALWKR